MSLDAYTSSLLHGESPPFARLAAGHGAELPPVSDAPGADSEKVAEGALRLGNSL